MSHSGLKLNTGTEVTLNPCSSASEWSSPRSCFFLLIAWLCWLSKEPWIYYRNCLSSVTAWAATTGWMQTGMIPGNWFHNHSELRDRRDWCCKAFPPRGLCFCVPTVNSLTEIKNVHKHRWGRLLTFLLFTSCSSIPLNFHLLHFQIDYENVERIKKPHRNTQKHGRMKK